MRSRMSTIACFLILLATRADARTWNIVVDGSGDAPTVQAGVDSAAPGDVVMLGPGTYGWAAQGAAGGSMIGMRRDITLRGAAGATSTVLDAEYSGRVLRCENTGDTRLEALTIRRGNSGVIEGGGGIRAFGDTRLTVSDCVIEDNFAGRVDGGGILATSPGTTIQNCQFLRNRAGFDAGGGGIRIYGGSGTITNCTFRDNTAPGGGAILAIDTRVADCWFVNNTVSGPSDALLHIGPRGGAISLGPGSLERCTFVRNRANGVFSEGGAVNCGSSVTISQCIFVENAAIFGAAVKANLMAPVLVTSCTFAGNRSSAGEALKLDGMGAVQNSIIASTFGRPCSGNATFSCCDLYGNSDGDLIQGIDGGGNFTADPRFCSDPAVSLNVALAEGSPCSPGYHPNGAQCGLIGAAPPGCTLVAIEERSWSSIKMLYAGDRAARPSEAGAR